MTEFTSIETVLGWGAAGVVWWWLGKRAHARRDRVAKRRAQPSSGWLAWLCGIDGVVAAYVPAVAMQLSAFVVVGAGTYLATQLAAGPEYSTVSFALAILPGVVYVLAEISVVMVRVFSGR